jgi:hypothetical protein
MKFVNSVLYIHPLIVELSHPDEQYVIDTDILYHLSLIMLLFVLITKMKFLKKEFFSNQSITFS